MRHCATEHTLRCPPIPCNYARLQGHIITQMHASDHAPGALDPRCAIALLNRPSAALQFPASSCPAPAKYNCCGVWPACAGWGGAIGAAAAGGAGGGWFGWEEGGARPAWRAGERPAGCVFVCVNMCVCVCVCLYACMLACVCLTVCVM